MCGQPGHDTQPHTRTPPSFLGMDASQLNVALIHNLFWSLMCLAYSFDMLSMGICTTRHWQTPSQLVQELNVCTIPSFCISISLSCLRSSASCRSWRKTLSSARVKGIRSFPHTFAMANIVSKSLAISSWKRRNSGIDRRLRREKWIK